jgi:hypothetical protein
MASLKCVTAVLAAWHELYPTRELTADTAAVWSRLFPDVSDQDFTIAGDACARQAGRKFFPTPGELAFFLESDEPPAISAHEMLRRIRSLCVYDVGIGYVYPRVETVRSVLGDAAAQAYGNVGPHRLGSDNQTTRDIAERDFAGVLEREQAAHPPRSSSFPQLGSGEQPPELPPG